MNRQDARSTLPPPSDQRTLRSCASGLDKRSLNWTHCKRSARGTSRHSSNMLACERQQAKAPMVVAIPNFGVEQGRRWRASKWRAAFLKTA